MQAACRVSTFSKDNALRGSAPIGDSVQNNNVLNKNINNTDTIITINLFGTVHVIVYIIFTIL